METLTTDIVRPGEIITGTMLNSDLIPRFTHEVLWIICDAFKQGKMSMQEHEAYDKAIAVIESHIPSHNYYTYYNSELADDDTEQLFDILNELAPEGHYFGAHPGDGACFGFWLCEDD